MPSTFQMGGVAGVPMAEAGDRALFGVVPTSGQRRLFRPRDCSDV